MVFELAHNATVVDNDRNLTGQIQFQKFGRVGRLEAATEIFPDKRNADLLANPKYLPDVEGIGAAEDPQGTVRR